MSFYQFLFATDPSELADYLSNANIRKALKRGENIERWKNAYPLYANEIESIIQSQYKKGMETRELLSRSVGVVKCYLAKEGAKKEDVELERVCPRRLEEMLAETARSILTDAYVKRLMKSKTNIF
ncbi:hypothetical protein [Wolbachia endosymbiont (group E) of Neria commutata]|uniref:hypothetical protein n=1 Tax=Wolbachia endosymbiont (group E) of Neria commutata TaxID=3066149 RepID=UPI003132D4CE